MQLIDEALLFEAARFAGDDYRVTERMGMSVGTKLAEIKSAARPLIRTRREAVLFVCNHVWPAVFGARCLGVRREGGGVYSLPLAECPWKRFVGTMGCADANRLQAQITGQCTSFFRGVVLGALRAVCGPCAEVRVAIKHVPAVTFVVEVQGA